MTEGNGFVNLEDLALMLSLHRNTIMRLAEKGELPKPIKIGTQYRFYRSEILECIQKKKEQR